MSGRACNAVFTLEVGKALSGIKRVVCSYEDSYKHFSNCQLTDAYSSIAKRKQNSNEEENRSRSR